MSEPKTPIDPELLKILRCPVALEQGKAEAAKLQLHRESWLVCEASQMKYPIRDGIPVMLVDVAKQWKDTAVADLPVPPPEDA
ncbi:MAG: Trm112 family protein [Deltaproteobacteria bacterium]|nr:Trm112 family protein [Deltaproteobacteria bacterium]